MVAYPLAGGRVGWERTAQGWAVEQWWGKLAWGRPGLRRGVGIGEGVTMSYPLAATPRTRGTLSRVRGTSWRRLIVPANAPLRALLA